MKLVPYTLTIDTAFSEEALRSGMYLAIIHATRIPPHMGIIAEGYYQSLSIKGQEINVPMEALVRNNTLRKIPSLFIKIKAHPGFNEEQLRKNVVRNVQQFPKVEIGKATCLSPVKLFFEETYGISMQDVHYIFELLPKLEAAGLLENTAAMFIDAKELQLPVYNLDEINKGIAKAEADAKEIVKAAKN